MIFGCKEDSLHFEYLYEFNWENNYDGGDNNYGGKSSAVVIELWIPPTSEVSSFRKEVENFYHKLFKIFIKTEFK